MKLVVIKNNFQVLLVPNYRALRYLICIVKERRKKQDSRSFKTEEEESLADAKSTR